MNLSLEEFQHNFFNPERVTKYLENRKKWIEEYKKADDASRWTTYMMFLGTLAAAGRMDGEEFQRLGPNQYQAGNPPTPERLYTLTALIDLLK